MIAAHHTRRLRWFDVTSVRDRDDEIEAALSRPAHDFVGWTAFQDLAAGRDAGGTRRLDRPLRHPSKGREKRASWTAPEDDLSLRAP
jgi:hypothetical protein